MFRGTKSPSGWIKFPVLDIDIYFPLDLLSPRIPEQQGSSWGRLNIEGNGAEVLGCTGTEFRAATTTLCSGGFTPWLFCWINKCFTCLINRRLDFYAAFLNCPKDAFSY